MKINTPDLLSYTPIHKLMEVASGVKIRQKEGYTAAARYPCGGSWRSKEKKRWNNLLVVEQAMAAAASCTHDDGWRAAAARLAPTAAGPMTGKEYQPQQENVQRQGWSSTRTAAAPPRCLYDRPPWFFPLYTLRPAIWLHRFSSSRRLGDCDG
ncbi:unnamed protein product [Lactuca saligna]|uniref:Uncharacterized protein n=1 Tax=Lactuca saligna TaxID=75948 RepID=A0AA35Z0E9_LACSI|nr:unnamed protein product [Lactuca saligna]